MYTRIISQVLAAGLLLLLGARPARAQEAVIEKVEQWSFTGLRDVGGQFYYFLRGVRNKPGELVLELYDRDLKRLSATTVTLGYYTTLHGTGLVAGAAVFFFQSGDKARLLKFDAAGQKVGETSFGAESVFGSRVYLQAVGTGGDFYAAYPVQTNKKGFMVIRYGPDLAAKWQKEFSPEKGRYQLKGFEATDATVYALADFSKEGYRVIALDGATGAERGQQALPAPELELTPDLTALDAAGNLLVAGAYVEKTGARTDGFFTLKVSSAGQPGGLGKTPYSADVTGLLRSHSTLTDVVTPDKPRLKMHTLLARPDGGFTLVGETYRDAGSIGSSPGTMVPYTRSVFDLAVIQVNAQGQMETIRRIGKPFRLYQQEGGLGRFSGPEEFLSRTSFSYRFLPAGPGATSEPAVVLFNWHANQYYINQVRLSDRRENLFTRTYLDYLAVPDQDRGERTVWKFAYDPPTGKSGDALAYTNILPHAPGKLLFYHYDPVREALELKVLPIPAWRAAQP